MALYEAILNALRLLALGAGSLIVFWGLVLGAFRARGPGGRPRRARQIGEHAALGLEFFVGATLLNLILSPTPEALAGTAITIVVRRLITLSLRQSGRGGPATNPLQEP
ncbi:DUF1622 domain-containing protein [Rubrobacter indicoceani]|uniref:DUF1622 domain-containing protein n=1 Tax=Rubrobacter indicoceani TaxID=2051957 RepID=UPI000E5AD330|nr:DUF1622 domain-containing protein [Rubrobacter indicoceani]